MFDKEPRFIHISDIQRRPAVMQAWERRRHTSAHWIVECVAEFVRVLVLCYRTILTRRCLQIGVFFYVYAGQRLSLLSDASGTLLPVLKALTRILGRCWCDGVNGRRKSLGSAVPWMCVRSFVSLCLVLIFVNSISFVTSRVSVWHWRRPRPHCRRSDFRWTSQSLRDHLLRIVQRLSLEESPKVCALCLAPNNQPLLAGRIVQTAFHAWLLNFV